MKSTIFLLAYFFAFSSAALDCGAIYKDYVDQMQLIFHEKSDPSIRDLKFSLAPAVDNYKPIGGLVTINPSNKCGRCVSTQNIGNF